MGHTPFLPLFVRAAEARSIPHWELRFLSINSQFFIGQIGHNRKSLQIILSSPFADWKPGSLIVWIYFLQGICIYILLLSTSVCLLPKRKLELTMSRLLPKQALKFLWIVDVPSFFSSQLGSNNNSVTALWPFS